ncbi:MULTISPECIES: radical SAM family heme chaperone HemW [Exiguobacterium]|uniref:Heme chaperone HemW n=1 Tax=Exiguobacterium antarcticum TaxID=132920 RepID=A0ABT6QZN8_9BACL|nr:MULTISPECIES: radical SAM family heme chaperone HemW [Exiguobacterium]AFS69895.1 Oxygen-independent coproporphyrinogen-III oxidase 1 [Exiguobacterium antarcticum B7]MCT4779034.1 radical SAM family heme chaperone HemW [Exiguobacterium soli]MDI3234018.1 radical SAM family heme chaperone HemW [Exiguobacterium antarcticum]
MTPRAAYVHIPFCEHICYYCDFNKVFLKNQPVAEYLDALEREIELTLQQYPTDRLETIFIGGGTPTALNEPQMQRLMDIITKHLLPLTDETLEYTVESNPDGVSPEKLDIMKAGGVNRVSFGVQSFDDGLLERIGRTHREAKVAETLDHAAKRFDNISVDLMFGLPNQTLEQVKYDVERALRLPITHISSYSLILEPHTVFAIQERKGKLPLPTQDLEADMYRLMIETIEAGGLKQYEISNFSLPNRESRHNRVYWENDEYYGFGAGSHSYINQTRRANIAPIPHYIKAEGLPVRNETLLTIVERMEEEMFLGLRMKEGVSEKHFEHKYGLSLDKVFGKTIAKLLPRGLVERTATHIRLTDAGVPLANEVFAEFIGEAEME